MIKKLLKPTFKKRIIFFLIFDIISSIFSLYSAYLLRFNLNIEHKYLHNFLEIAALFVFIKVLFLSLFGQYSIVWRFYTLNDAKRLLFAHILSYFLILLFTSSSKIFLFHFQEV